MPMIMGHKVIYGNPLDALDGWLKEAFPMEANGKGCLKTLWPIGQLDMHLRNL